MSVEATRQSVPLERAELVARLWWFIRLRWVFGGTLLGVGLFLTAPFDYPILFHAHPQRQFAAQINVFYF